MARGIHRLSAVRVSRLRKRGFYSDGGGLYLQVARGGSKSWVFRFKTRGRAREMGLGSLNTVSLSDARKKARDARELRDQGRDPIEARNAQRAALASERARATTFEQAASAYVAAHRDGWRNDKHKAQWESTIATYAEPLIGALSVDAIDTALVMKVLEPIWTATPETASRLRGRIEAILDWAKVRGLRVGENPARWRGHLAKLLPAPSKVRRVKHHAALPYLEIGAFMTDVRSREGIAARALDFTILTAMRTEAVIGAKPIEISKPQRVWTIPGHRMKGGLEFRVPLSDAAMAVIEQLRGESEGEFLFPGQRPGRPLSNMAMLTFLQRRLGRSDLTVHGFRSTFRDWAAERTNFPNEVAEAALAHTISDKVEAAYRRGDLFDKRRSLMDAWATHCERPAAIGAVVDFRSAS
jgi:integrase